MITYILITLWVLFLIAVPVVMIFGIKSTSYKFKHFEDIEIPYVTMDIQGNLFNMVVDSGCAVSLLNVPSIRGCELMYQKTDKEVALSALTSDRIESRAINVKFNIGKKEVSEDFYLQNHEDFGNFERMHGITIHGLLGSSFFHKNNCKIDFEKHELIVL